MRTISELIRLEGRSAIVTGGAGHIGLAICETLLELGAKLSILDLGGDKCVEACNLLNDRNYKEKAIPIPADLSDEKETRSSVLEAVKRLGGLDILIHSAAFVGTTDFPGWAVPFEEQSVEAWDSAMRVNVTSSFIIVQAVKPYLEVSRSPSVIFINSIYGLVGPDNRIYEGTTMITPAAYATSKGGIGQLMRYLATSLAPKIRINSITAGGVRRGQASSFQERYIERTPLKRMATEEDFKGAVAYLASDLSSYVTGSNLIVDGGWTAW